MRERPAREAGRRAARVAMSLGARCISSFTSFHQGSPLTAEMTIPAGKQAIDRGTLCPTVSVPKNHNSDFKASCEMYLASKQADKPPPDVPDDDCLRRPQRSPSRVAGGLFHPRPDKAGACAALHLVRWFRPSASHQNAVPDC